MSSFNRNLSGKEIFSALFVVVLWGLNFVPTKVALNDFTPFQLGAGRFLLAAIPLVFFVKFPKVPFLWMLLYVVSQGIGQFSLLFFALQLGATAALVSVLMQVQIFFTAFIGAMWLGESISTALKFGMGIAGIGLACFGFNIIVDGNSNDASWLGVLLVLAAAAMWAFSNIVVKKIHMSSPTCTPLALIVWSSLWSGIGFLLISVLIDPLATPLVGLGQVSILSWLSLIYLAWIASGLAYWLWTSLLTVHPASRIAPFSLGIPIVGLLAGIYILDEKVSTIQWIGVTFVMMSLIFVVLSGRLRMGRMSRRYRREL